jgi:hypothetical protein
MSNDASRPLLRRPQFPSDLRRLFRELARLAVASSFGVTAAACTRYQLDDEPIPEPEPGGQGGYSGQGPIQNDGGWGGTGGTGGASGAAGVGGTGGFSGSAGFGGVGGSSGIGGFGGTAGMTPEAPWQPIPCDPNTLQPSLLSFGSLQRPIDFAALYRVMFDAWGFPLEDGGATEPAGYVTEQVLLGAACSNANDWATCNQSLAALKPTPEACLNGDACRVLITTEGDALTRIEERAALVGLLGSIDTAKEAALAVWLTGTDVACVNEATDPPFGTFTRVVDGGIEVESRIEDCASNSSFLRRELVRPDGTVIFLSQITLPAWGCPVAGRRPEGLQAVVSPVPCSELGVYFASAAHLEAASVHAFARFARELHALGAPEELVADAWRAALEEIAHTKMVGLIAERFGAEVPEPSIEAPPPRDAFAIALENAVEGCVRETYGALVAWYQAETALDPMVKNAMAQIAEDETRHADLSWRVAQWLEPQLSERERARIDTARSDAFNALRDELSAAGLSAAAAALIGLPDQNGSVALLNQLGTALSLSA